MSSTVIQRFSTELDSPQWAMSKPRPSVIGSWGRLQQNSSAATTRPAPRRSASNEKKPSKAPISRTEAPPKLSGKPTKPSLSAERSIPGVTIPSPRSMVWNQGRANTRSRNSSRSTLSGSARSAIGHPLGFGVELAPGLTKPARGGQQGPVETHGSGRHRFGRVPSLKPPPSRLAHRPAQLRRAGQAAQGVGERPRVAGGDEEPGLAIDHDLGHAPDVGSDHGLREHHRLEQHQ